jgi:CelD/BcsL family acetyltransferase involved in cellulose biosynthesis
LRAERAGALAGLALLTSRRGRWLRLLPNHQLHLHETGEPTLDSLTIEYNGIISAPALREEVTMAAIAWLLSSPKVDEVHLPGLPEALLSTIDGRRFAVRLRDRKPTFLVELDRIRAADGSFIETLSANTRAQLRRVIRQFGALGALRLVEAMTAEDALRMLEDMIPLHQAYWQSRGRPGAFANPEFLSFHRRLITDGFPSGSVQVLRCEAGDHVVGYLYNFVKDGLVYSYQSGFDYDLLPRSKPGWLCHFLAIEHNLQRGMTGYDLLAGASQFKASFGKTHENLVWAIVERVGWKPTLVRHLRTAKRWLKSPRRKT